jgi:hypothetical protein
MGISLLARPDATRYVLPFVTGLVGFLEGLVVAMYNVERGDTRPRVTIKDDKPPRRDEPDDSGGLGESKKDLA